MKNAKVEDNRKIILTAMISLFLFLNTTFLVFGKYNWFKNIEDYIFIHKQLTFGNFKMNYTNNLFHNFIAICAKYGNILPVTILTLTVMLVLCLKKQYFTSLWLGTTIGSGGLIGIIMKLIFKRPRPINHLAIDSGYSYPSGHSLGSTIFLGSLFFLVDINVKNKLTKRIIQFILVLLWIGTLFSRIYFNAHYLGDVVGGVFWGIFWLFSFIYLYIKHAKSLN